MNRGDVGEGGIGWPLAGRRGETRSMPTYEYECRKCGHRFEKFQPITAAPLKTCPECKGRVNRLLSGGAGIISKGSGFYQTDYKKTGSAGGGKKKGESGAGEAKGDGGTKEAAKADKTAK